MKIKVVVYLLWGNTKRTLPVKLLAFEAFSTRTSGVEVLGVLQSRAQGGIQQCLQAGHKSKGRILLTHSGRLCFMAEGRIAMTWNGIMPFAG